MEIINGKGLQENLDEIDHFIIEALRHDGRTAFAQIAQQLKVSPGMIRVRYNRLVDLGILKVAAITNPLRMGFKTMAMVGIRTDGNRMLEVAETLASFDEVIYLIVVSGRYDILAEVVVRDHDDLLRFITEKLYSVEGVRESESFMHLKIAKEVYF
jgi:Lrp/AsnC family transcriptional regulator, regulator for asnA, asnC and gidA